MPKIEVEKQHDLKDCGACCLSSIIKYYKGYVPLEKIREDTYTNSEGTTAYHLIMAAKNYGFDAIGVKVTSLSDPNIYLPAIAHVILKNGLTHFVVIYKIASNYVYLMDPAKGKVKLKISDFQKIWDNVLILFTPLSSDIIHYEKMPNLLFFFMKLLKINSKIFINIILISTFLMIMSIISSFYFQAAISTLNAGNDSKMLKIFVLIFGFIIISKVIFEFLRNYYLNYLNKNIDISIFSTFLTHIFNLPLKFMQNRSTGEIVSRVEELSEIKNFLSEVFTNLILNSILMLGSIAVLYHLNARLFFILCLIIGIYGFIGLLFSKLIYRQVKVNLDVATEFNSVLIENIQMNNSIKNLNLINTFLKKLENNLVVMLKNNFHLEKILNNLEAIKNFIYEFGLFLLTTYGIYLISINKLTLLELITFNSILIYLINPVKDLLAILPKYYHLKASFSKLNEFLSLKLEEDEGLKCLPNPKIKMTDVCFSYNNYQKIIANFNLELMAGSKVFLSGPSGSGKSTICKLLCRNGLSTYSGEVKLNESSESDFSLSAIRENILYVGQNEHLFSGTIKENIICYRNVKESEFLKIAQICRLESIVANKPYRYNTLINASINNLSGGEKQRIILARGLLKPKTKIIILDEALSEVNESMEKEIIKDIFLHFKNQTLIYVSHKNVKDLFPKTISIGASHV